MGSINAIGYAEMLAYFQLKDITPTEEEISILRKLDSIALKHNSEQVKKHNKQRSNTPSKKR